MADITIYTRALCGYCSAAKALLDRKKVDYDEIDATFSSEKRSEMARRSGRTTFPQIFVGSHHVGGFDDMNALERAGKFDSLLEGVGGANDGAAEAGASG